MKLLFVIPSITNYFTFLEGLIDALTKRNHEVHLATSRKHIARISAYRREIKCEVHDIDFPRALDPFRHYAAGKKVAKIGARYPTRHREYPFFSGTVYGNAWKG